MALAAEVAGLPDTWEGVCDWVLAKQVDPWDQLYEAAFLQVMQPNLSTCDWVHECALDREPVQVWRCKVVPASFVRLTCPTACQ